MHLPKFVLIATVWMMAIAFTCELRAQNRETKSPWAEIERLAEEQKFQAALEKTTDVLKKARVKRDNRLILEALIKSTQLQIGLHGTESAVRFLKQEPWPQTGPEIILLHLYYAKALMFYQSMYSWEIGQREKMVTQDALDLRSWTTADIDREIGRSFDLAMTETGALAQPVPKFFRSYLSHNTYPKGIRPTLRDAVVYLAVEYLGQQQFWSPSEANEVYKLDIKKLAQLVTTRRLPLADEDPHPLVKLASWLGEHRAFHLKHLRNEAALEAHYQALEALDAAVSQDQDKRVLIETLKRVQDSSRVGAWWARGQALLARFLQVASSDRRLIEARREALRGKEAYPGSPGARQCEALIAEIEKPSYRLEQMAIDGVKKPSILLTYRNVKTFYLRLYPLDLEGSLTKKAGSRTPWGHSFDVAELLKDGRKPTAEWSVQPEATQEFLEHRRFVEMPQVPHGLYAVVVSEKSDFSRGRNQLTWAPITVSNLIVSTRMLPSGDLQAQAFRGDTGQPMPDVELALYRHNYQAAPELSASVKTQAQGLATLKAPKSDTRTHWNYFLLARHQGEVVSVASDLYFWRSETPSERKAALIFTDRSIYRPEQKLQFKIVAYSGNPMEGRFKTAAAGEAVKVVLIDPNHQIAAEMSVKLNSFGSGSGEFVLPTNRPLGNWRLSSQVYSANSSIKVEEYKRPTFEVEFKNSLSELQLNRQVKLLAEARYYFGLPVTAAKVRWHVTRSEILPWWWYAWRIFAINPRPPTIVASGTTTVNQNGEFKIDFLPEADARASRELNYQFTIQAEVTDQAGETRVATRALQLGFVGVTTVVNFAANFFAPDEELTASAIRSTLDGKKASGTASYRVIRLVAPPTTPLPADLPRAENELTSSSPTRDDRKRARWETGISWQQVTENWREGEIVARGNLQHDREGLANVRVKPLRNAGVYRFIYQTKDKSGATFKFAQDLLVSGTRQDLRLPLVLLEKKPSARVGEKLRLLVSSGFAGQSIIFEKFRSGRSVERRVYVSGQDATEIDLPIAAEDRGGFTLSLTAVRDHQMMRIERSIEVPWDDRELKLEFSSFRDRLRPGARETFALRVKDPNGQVSGSGVAEVLAYMYDRSLDSFSPHLYPSVLAIYPSKQGAPEPRVNLAMVSGSIFVNDHPYQSVETFVPDQLQLLSPIPYGIGGPGHRRGQYFALSEQGTPQARHQEKSRIAENSVGLSGAASTESKAAPPAAPAIEQTSTTPMRVDFSETAFFLPHLLSDANGDYVLQFTVPDSVTSWHVFAHAITRDLKGGSIQRETKSVKELLVRPSAPRFLREGDQAEIKVSISNTSNRALNGEVTFDIEEADSEKSALAEFGWPAQAKKSFSLKPLSSTSLSFPVKAPPKVGLYAFKVRATTAAKTFSDGERRPFPVLPSRVHLAESRFVSLRDKDRKTLEFKDLAQDQDPTRRNEKLVVTLDTQLFYGVLKSLPYLLKSPYQCSEQILNRYVSTGILTSLFNKYPGIAAIAKEFASRPERLERFDADDPNRRMTLEETPWLEFAQGSDVDSNRELYRILDPKIAKQEQERAIQRLRKMQLSSGAFPWFEGGPPDQFMTLSILLGLSRALEFKVEVPKDITVKAWKYVHDWLRAELDAMMSKNCCSEIITLVVHALSSYPDETWSGGVFDLKYRQRLLDYSRKNWQLQSPRIKGYLALSLNRMGRTPEAQQVWNSVIDSAKFDEQIGTYWSPEERSWLWYNDTIESQALALRVQMELNPTDKRNAGLVQWLFMNKKLNHWKSTRATAEVIYSLANYLDRNSTLDLPEKVEVTVGDRAKMNFVFEPGKYTGQRNQIVLKNDEITAKTASILVEKSTPGIAFATATWHFSTEQFPKEGSSDFFTIKRAYFKREQIGQSWELRPLIDGAEIRVGDQVEVQISVQSRHTAEYVHLKDPRAAGFEPESQTSGYKFDLGLFWYEEPRDNGSNFFFTAIPHGQYTFNYRLRATMAGRFRVGPASIQSMYAPEFVAYSQGHMMTIR